MKKLISLILILTVIFSAFSMSIVKADTLSEKLTDTSDFSFTSIELTEQMLIGYNIGNGLETNENRSDYKRPEFSTVEEWLYYRETVGGMIPITEEYIKYLSEIGVQAIRLPITWFNVLEDENGNLYPVNFNYGSNEVKQDAYKNGKINEEFLARVTQIVNWIIENDMYCIINTHHDAGCNNANSVLPIKMDGAHKEQTYNYFTNIWTQVGEHFKDYGSKLLFEFFNEASDSSGSMTQTEQRSAFVAELLTYLIPLIRNQGSNNANRFLVCPAYGGVSFWSNIDGFKDSDTADDKLIITTHKYESASSIRNAVSSARSKMNNLGVGAIIDEIGHSWSGTISEDYITLAQNLRKASDEYKVSCFFWDNGDYDFTLVNRHYCTPSTPALSAYVGKDLEYKTYTKGEVINLTKSDQPNWVEVYTPDAKNIIGKKYLIIASEKKIKTFDTVKAGAGYYVHSGAENGLVTYFDSDDGVNYTIRNTVIPTAWTKKAWGTFHVYGSTFETDQIGGNYEIEKIGEGLQGYVATGENLILQGGNWRKGHYSTSGNYEGEGTTYYNQRISLENKIQVTPGAYYLFSISETQTRYKLIIRAYNENGNFVSNLGTVDAGAIQAPNSAHYFSISIYDSKGSEGAEKQLSLLADGTLKPTMHLFVYSKEPACNHIAKEGCDVVIEPTCQEDGYTEHLCSVCDRKYKTNIVARLNSCVAEEGKDKVVDATCGEDGYTEHTCKFCGNKFKTDTVSATGKHTPDATKDKVVNATCKEVGYTEHSCSVCKKTYKTDETDIDPDAHNVKIAQAVESTCTENGLTEGSYCSWCSKIIVAQEETSKKPHTEYVSRKGYEPTCKGAGYTDEISCSVCNAVLVERERIPKISHVEVIDMPREASCSQTGLTKGSHCKNCGEIIIAQVESPKKPHTEIVDRGYAATCEKAGLTNGKHCSVCGEVTLAQKEIAKLPHIIGNWEIISESERVKKCLVCNTVVESEKITAICVHLTVIKNAKKATYFATGYTGDLVCSKCNETLTKGTITAKLTLKVPKFKLTKGKKQFKVKYTKVAGAAGFQVRYKIKGKWKTKTFNTKKTATKVVKKLKKGNYQVQIRAMIVSGKQKAYSAWSKTQKVKVK